MIPKNNSIKFLDTEYRNMRSNLPNEFTAYG